MALLDSAGAPPPRCKNMEIDMKITVNPILRSCKSNCTVKTKSIFELKALNFNEGMI